MAVMGVALSARVKIEARILLIDRCKKRSWSNRRDCIDFLRSNIKGVSIRMDEAKRK